MAHAGFVMGVVNQFKLQISIGGQPAKLGYDSGAQGWVPSSPFIRPGELYGMFETDLNLSPRLRYRYEPVSLDLMPYFVDVLDAQSVKLFRSRELGESGGESSVNISSTSVNSAYVNGVPGFFNQGAGVWLRKPNQIPTRHYLQSGDSVRVRQGQDDLGFTLFDCMMRSRIQNYPSILRGLPLGAIWPQSIRVVANRCRSILC